MNGWHMRDFRSPESIASALVGLLAVALLATQVLAGRGEPDTRVEPSASITPSASPTMDPEIRRALGTALAVNQSLAGRVLALEPELGVATPVAADIAAHLRTVNTDLTAGTEAADRLLRGDQTAVLGRDLGAFYDAV